MTTFIDTAEVAARLGQDPAHFLRVRAELEDRHGFPVPVPHWKRPLKWRADQIDSWIKAQGRPKAPAPLPALGANVLRMCDYARI